MPRDRRSTSFTASPSFLYGHMRKPPSAGPRTVLWIAMIAFSPASLLWQNTTSSWPVLEIVSKIIGTAPGKGFRRRAAGYRHDRGQQSGRAGAAGLMGARIVLTGVRR